MELNGSGRPAGAASGEKEGESSSGEEVGGGTMDDKPRYWDVGGSAFGGEIRRLGVQRVQSLRDRYISHKQSTKGELPREGAARAASSRWHECEAAPLPPALVENGEQTTAWRSCGRFFMLSTIVHSLGNERQVSRRECRVVAHRLVLFLLPSKETEGQCGADWFFTRGYTCTQKHSGTTKWQS